MLTGRAAGAQKRYERRQKGRREMKRRKRGWDKQGQIGKKKRESHRK